MTVVENIEYVKKYNAERQAGLGPAGVRFAQSTGLQIYREKLIACRLSRQKPGNRYIKDECPDIAAINRAIADLAEAQASELLPPDLVIE